MKTLYIDAFSGISGDMFLGALVDLGVDLDHLREQLVRLNLSGYSLEAERTHRRGLAAVKVEVRLSPTQADEFRHWATIRKLLSESSLPQEVKSDSLRVFERLMQAEAQVHGVELEEVHLHELASPDTIIDVVGTVVGLRRLGIERIVSSPLNLGRGRVQTAHGEYPVPGPAVMELMQGFPAYAAGDERELTTPTGAALATTLAAEFAPLPPLRIEGTGYGAGSWELLRAPNVLRLILGDSSPLLEGDRVMVLETNIDDMNPEFYPFLMDRLFSRGALDVTLTPLMMKKGRPGIQVSVLAEEKDQERITRVLFEESSTLGVRAYPVQRQKLSRTQELVSTRYGSVRIKVGWWEGKPIQWAPEYEDCYRLACELGLSPKEVFEEAQAAARNALREKAVSA